MVIINGKEIEFVSGESVYDHARRAELVDRSIIAAKINGNVCGLTAPINDGDTAELLSFAEPPALQRARLGATTSTISRCQESRRRRTARSTLITALIPQSAVTSLL